MDIQDSAATPHTKRFWRDVVAGLKSCLNSARSGWPANPEQPNFICASRWHAVVKEARLDEPAFSARLDSIVEWIIDQTKTERRAAGRAGPTRAYAAELAAASLSPLGAAQIGPSTGGADAFMKACCFLPSNRIPAKALKALDADHFICLKPTPWVARVCGLASLDLSTAARRARVAVRYLASEGNPVLWLTPLDDALEARLLTKRACIDHLVHELGLPHFRIDPRRGSSSEVTILKIPTRLLSGIAHVPTVADALLYHHFEPSEAAQPHGWTIGTKTGKETRPEIVARTARLAKKAAAAKGATRPDILARPDGKPFHINEPSRFPVRYFQERHRRFEVLASARSVI